MKYDNIAAGISSRLRLASPPVALSFVEAAPTGMAVFDQEVPSACVFWRRAETEVFYAPAEKHFNCPIGAMTMGFDMPKEVKRNLMGVVEMMCGAGYISPEEASRIPTVEKKKSGIAYGPLRAFTTDPDLVLMWLTPGQAMIYSEAAGACRWTEAMPTPAFGRPSCAALPAALDKLQSTLSLGCLGMRIFTDVSQDKLLAVLPGSKIEEFARALESVTAANQTMGEFYQGHKAKYVTTLNR
jgi:uncharacterized protein (DUF169 family)